MKGGAIGSNMNAAFTKYGATLDHITFIDP
jgi:hypothetical protein